MKRSVISFLIFMVLTGVSVGRLKVATLHPLMADLAREVGGDRVEIVELLGVKGDAHRFRPGAAALRKAGGARLYLASGKGFESYLPKLRQTLAGSAEVMEVGRRVPSIKVSGGDSLFVCCPEHARGALDPHWWHSIYNMRKAALLVAEKFAQLDSDNEKFYRTNAKAYAKRLNELKRWARIELAKVPRQNRKLATAHAAFGYFCKEFGFKSLPVQGLTKDQAPTAAYLREVSERVRSEGVSALFPEPGANPKTLKSIADATGLRVGGYLNADGMVSNYESFIRANVRTIVAALGVAE